MDMIRHDDIPADWPTMTIAGVLPLIDENRRYFS